MTTGADQTPGLFLGPLLAVSGSSWGPARCVVFHVLWIVCGRLPLRGCKGPGPIVLSQVLARSRGHTCRTLRGTGSVCSAILTIREVPQWHVSVVPNAAEAAVRAVLVCCRPLGAAVQRRPRNCSAVTGALVAGHAVR